AEVQRRIFDKYVERRYEFETLKLDEGVQPPFSLDEFEDALGAATLDLLNRFQRVEIDLGPGWSRVTRTEGGPVDIVEMEIRAIRRRLGPQAFMLLALAQRLKIIIPTRPGYVRFVHVLMRDHFAARFCKVSLREQNADARRVATGALGLIR